MVIRWRWGLFAGATPLLLGPKHTGTSELKAQHVTKDQAVHFASRVVRTSATWLGIAGVALALAAIPAEAKQKHQKSKPADEPIADINNGEPMTLVISTGAQKIDIYRGTTLITTSQVSTGTAAHPTFLGVFSILEKQRWHHSNIYSGAPMPWMNRITWSGTAIHAGVVPGYPASHGCIRLPYSFAPKLFQITTVGDGVVIARDRPVPKLVEHTALFQPLPPPPPPAITEQDKAPEHHAAATKRPDLGAAAASPVILAKAEIFSATTDASPLMEPTPGEAEKHATAEPVAGDAPAAEPAHAVDAAEADPYRTHAVVDPSAAADGGHAIAADSVGAIQPTPPAPTPADAPVPAALIAPVPTAPLAAVSPTVPATKLDAGVKAAALQAAEPRSNAPLRMLVTRRTQRDRIVGMQNIFASMGYLPMQNFDGTIGKSTVGAIKAFQKANGMPETGSFTDELVKKVYAVSGKGEPPAGHLFVRQEFGRLFDVPVSFKNPDQPLGTHVYTAMNFKPGDTTTRWTGITLVDTGQNPLDRIEIPDDVRQKIGERLTPGSSLIIADTSINTTGLPKGGDFVVFANYSAAAKTGATAAVAEPQVVKPKVHRSVRRYYNTAPYYTNRYYAPWQGWSR
jgi:lipoprotein-anchoring transpeptidase ErfK/SrfK/peptidoglycan hydrolase-like protein with peptidoglycan-binding domain